MQIYWREPLELCHHHDKSCDHNHCDNGDILRLQFAT